jgi:Ras-related protein Rab-8A
MLVFDVAERRTFENVLMWMEQIHEYADSSVHVVLVGNKCDLDPESRRVSYEEGAALAQKIGYSYIETSAKIGLNVAEAYSLVAQQTKEK